MQGINLDFEKKSSHRHISFLLIITIFLAVIILLLIKPAMLGYKLSNQIEEIGIKPDEFMKSIDTIKSRLVVSETNLNTCQSYNNDLINAISNEKNQTFKCLLEKEIITSEIESIRDEFQYNLSSIKSSFEENTDKILIEFNKNNLVLNKTLENYFELAQKSADNICCKIKVDDKRIDSYIISDNMITCMSGEDKKINC